MGIPDETPNVSYWRWTPDDSEFPPGVYTIPPFGEVIPGRVVEVSERDLSLVTGSSQWTKAQQSQFEKQPSITDARAALNH